MRLRQVLFLVLFSLLQFGFAQAQNPAGKIFRTVLSDSKKPLDGATVMLLVAKDSTTVDAQLQSPILPELQQPTVIL
jgi:hypothetical protein